MDDTGQSSHNEGRSKRGVLHLYNMVKCATGCDPLSYKGYGCYCGFLGSGQPVDPIDRYAIIVHLFEKVIIIYSLNNYQIYY